MPRLILLNGPPGIGKSTVARRYVDEHPLALCIDLDLLRTQLGGWEAAPHETWGQARALGLVMVRAHLAAGHDVIVPQFLARPDLIVALEAVAAEVGAPFHELVLLDDEERAVARFCARSRRREAAGEPDPQGDVVGAEGGVASLTASYAGLLALLGDRPGAVRIPAPEGDLDGTYAAVAAAVAERDALSPRPRS